MKSALLALLAAVLTLSACSGGSNAVDQSAGEATFNFQTGTQPGKLYAKASRKPPKNVTALPGGTGIAFDWRLLTQIRVRKPWMLSGGLTAANLAEAVSLTGAKMVDVSSGVEDRPGVKSVERIREFLEAAARL